MHALKEKMARTIEALKEQIIDVAEAIYDHPETGNQEYFAVELLAGILAARGFKITRPLCQLPTAFRAELEGGIGPRVALIAEYDALPGLGHACGHNLIAAASLGAALALAETIKELGVPLSFWELRPKKPAGPRWPWSARAFSTIWMQS